VLQYWLAAIATETFCGRQKMIKDQINSLIWRKLPWLAIKLHSVGNNTVLQDSKFMAAYWETISEGQVFLSLRDMYNLYHYVSLAKNLDGDMAEVGVFQGRGAKIISLFKGDSRLHLFDTFEGMPTTDKAKDSHHATGDFSETSLEQVQTYLKSYSYIEYHKGRFPETTASVSSKSFSFVHLDADIFQSTLDGLNFFYPRMVEGGFIIAHDYSSATCSGVKAAFDVFVQKTNVFPVPLWDTQCLLIKHKES